MQMWAAFALILGALALYVSERLSIEVTSVGVICILIVFFQLFPVIGVDGRNVLSAERLLLGFANPALITVLALLVVGQGMVRTGALDRAALVLLKAGAGSPLLSVGIVMVVAMLISGVLNNIPVVVIFIPVIQMLADKLDRPASKMMMGLSFTAVLGGSVTLIGSGSNLLVSSALIELGYKPFDFFDFTVPGLVLAAAGLVYVLGVLPFLLPDRTSLAYRIMSRSPKHFLTQIAVAEDSRLLGAKAVGGVIEGLPDVRVRMIIRGEAVMTPPYHDFIVEAGDMIVAAASRKAMSAAMSDDPGFLEAVADEPGGEEALNKTERVMAEVMIAPASSMIGLRLRQTGFQLRTRCFVLGVQRRAHMVRSRLSEMVLEAGDVLLVQGEPDDIRALGADRNIVLMEGSAEEMPVVHHAKRAGLIFLGVVALASSGMFPVVGAALLGAVGMVLTGALKVQQATRSLDSKIVTMIPAALAMGVAMQETGGAQFLAASMTSLVAGSSPAVILSGTFMMAAVLANVIGSNACAVLFTPIAVGLAAEAGVDPHVFAIAVVFAANAGLATPIGYQTNVLVMGPGHYRFVDFIRGGAPLVLVLWLVFSLFAPWYYGV